MKLSCESSIATEIAPTKPGSAKPALQNQSYKKTVLAETIHYFIVGITNSAWRAPSGQRAVTVFSRV